MSSSIAIARRAWPPQGMRSRSPKILASWPRWVKVSQRLYSRLSNALEPTIAVRTPSLLRSRLLNQFRWIHGRPQPYAVRDGLNFAEPPKPSGVLVDG